MNRPAKRTATTFLTGYFAAKAQEQRKLSAWAKGVPIAGIDAALWRTDAYGNAIYYPDHGNAQSQFGWDVDRDDSTPAAAGSARQLNPGWVPEQRGQK